MKVSDKEKQAGHKQAGQKRPATEPVEDARERTSPVQIQEVRIVSSVAGPSDGVPEGKRGFVRVADRDIKIGGKFLRIAHIDGEKYRFLGDPEAVIQGLKKSKKRVDIFTFIEKLPKADPKYKYTMEWDNYAAIPLTTFDDWWMNTLGFKGRNKAKQAEKKGVKVREIPFDENLVRGIWEIYNECPVRQGKPFGHYGKDIDTVRREASTFLDCSAFIGAYLGEQLIGFIKMTWDETNTQAGLMHIVSMVSQRDKSPTNALVVQAVRSCTDRKIPFLVYSNFAYGKKQKDSLSDFKERNGFQKIDVPRYFVPISALGAAAIKFGLQHPLTSKLPEPLMVKLREMRNNWYMRKLQGAGTPTEAS